MNLLYIIHCIISYRPKAESYSTAESPKKTVNDLVLVLVPVLLH